MKKLVPFVLGCLLCLVAPLTFAMAPTGYWKTIDDITGKPKSILQISQETNGMLSGKIVRIYPSPGFDQNEVCSACTGSRHNQRMVGMVVMQGLRQDPHNPNEWSGGQILDPKNGKTYRCMLDVINNGRQLSVRGYIGLPLFGRSQTWLRVAGLGG